MTGMILLIYPFFLSQVGPRVKYDLISKSDKAKMSHFFIILSRIAMLFYPFMISTQQ